MQLDIGNEPTLSHYEFFSSQIFGQVQTDGQMQSDAYEPTVQNAEVGSKKSIEALRRAF